MKLYPSFRHLLILFAIFFCCTSSHTTAQIIKTFAGNGSSSYGGDGGPATAAEINYPTCITIDGAGNLFFCDYTNARIRKINTSGIITTVGGNGTAGYSGDGRAATLASIQGPAGIAVDAAGNLYFADWLNYRVRKISTSGIITTIGGTGVYGYSGDGGPATVAQVSKPWGIAVDPTGNVYLSDRYNNRIRKIDTFGKISTIAGTGTPGWAGDGGPASSAQINDPCDLVIDVSGNLYFAEYLGNRVRKISTSGVISTIAGNGTAGYSGDGGPATAAELYYPVGLGVDKEVDNVYIGDYGNYRVRFVNSSGTITTIAGTGVAGYSGDGGPAALAQLENPYGISIGLSGEIYICDPFNYRIRVITTGFLNNSSVKENSGKLTVYPNPNNGSFMVNISSAIEKEAQVVITNMTGEIVKEIHTTTNKNVEISLRAPAGFYVVSAISGDTHFTNLISIE